MSERESTIRLGRIFRKWLKSQGDKKVTIVQEKENDKLEKDK